MCQEDTGKVMTTRKDHNVWKVVCSQGMAYSNIWPESGNGDIPRTIFMKNILRKSEGFSCGYGFSCFGTLKAAKEYQQSKIESDYGCTTVIPMVIPKGTKYAYGRIPYPFFGSFLRLTTLRADKLIYKGGPECKA